MLDFRIAHNPVEGRKIAGSVFPSPSKSAGTGTSVLSPHEMSMLLPKPVLDFRIAHNPVDGRKIAGSTFPSPS